MMKQGNILTQISVRSTMAPGTSVILIYANSEPQPNAKYSCAASVAIAR